MVSDSSFVGQYILDGSFIQGLIVEILGGFVFILILLYTLRPVFEISPVIIKYPDALTGQTKYSIKVINKSIFAAVDVEVHLSYFFYVSAVGNGNAVSPHKDNKTLNLIKNTYTYVPNRFHKDNEFALWFSTYDVLENFITQTGTNQINKTILIRVIMRHSLTGLTSAKEKTYSAIGQIQDGYHFKAGHSFDIVQV